MIVVGVDPHKQTHTAVAVAKATGELVEELTVAARTPGHQELLVWARRLGEERLFALEDCHHVSGSLERFLIARGERVVRVPPKLMGKARRGARSFAKSDAIDALAVARAALSEPDLVPARLAGPELDVKLLLSRREDLIAEATRTNNRLRWHLHDLDPGLEVGRGRLGRSAWMERLARRLARPEQTIARPPRLRSPLSREADRRGGGGGALRRRRQAGDGGRRCPPGCVLGAPAAPPPEPQGQPPAQPRPASDRRHSGAGACAGEGVLDPQAGRGKEPPRSAAVPEATPREGCLQTPSSDGTAAPESRKSPPFK